MKRSDIAPFLRRHRGRLAVILILVFVPSAAALSARAGYDQVVYGGGLLGGDTPLLLGYGSQDQPHPSVYYAYQPHGEVRIQLAIANNGDLPVLVMGIGQTDEWRTMFERSEVRLPPAPTLDALPLYPPAGGGPWYSEPFRPFQLPAHSGTTFALVAHFPDCSYLSNPMPTRAPGSTPQTGLNADGVAIDRLPIAFSVDGVARTTEIQLPATIVMAEPGPDSFGCPTSPFREQLSPGQTDPSRAP